VTDFSIGTFLGNEGQSEGGEGEDPREEEYREYLRTSDTR